MEKEYRKISNRETFIKELNTGNKDFTYVEFKDDFDFSNLNLSDVNISNSILNGAVMNNTILSGAKIKNTRLFKAKLKNVNLNDTFIHQSYLNSCNIINCSFVDAILSETNIDQYILKSCNFTGAKIFNIKKESKRSLFRYIPTIPSISIFIAIISILFLYNT